MLLRSCIWVPAEGMDGIPPRCTSRSVTQSGGRSFGLPDLILPAAASKGLPERQNGVGAPTVVLATTMEPASP